MHIFVVEQDRKKLELPEYELRDEQPELNQDSRVVRQKKSKFDEDVTKLDESTGDSEDTQQEDDMDPIPIYDEVSIPLAITQLRPTVTRSRTRSSTATTKQLGVLRMFSQFMEWVLLYNVNEQLQVN